MRLKYLFVYLPLSILTTTFYGCSMFTMTDQASTLSTNNHNVRQIKTIEWMESFNLNALERNQALSQLTKSTNRQDIWLRAILLTHSDASLEELKQAENLLLTDNTQNSESLKDYILKLNKHFQANKLELAELHKQILAYKRLLKKHKNETEVLENKIEALTDIEHQINYRTNKHIPELAP